MKDLFLIALLFVGAPAVHANAIDINCPNQVVWGAPQIAVEGNNQYLCRAGYAVNLNYKTKIPYFVVEHITAGELNQGVKRKDDFREDSEVPSEHRVTLKDYTGSGYDRGHMAPAADFTYDTKVMSESFLLTNMMPQNSGNNRGIWKFLEELTRSWTVKYKEVYVITGTIYDESSVTIGNGVGVPSFVYKIIIDPVHQKSISFKFPNIKLDPKEIENYIVTIADLEAITGINFDPNLPNSAERLELTKASLKDW